MFYLPAKLHMIFDAWTISPIRLGIVTPYQFINLRIIFLYPFS